MQLAEGSHRSWWFNRLGKNSRAFNTPFGRCGFLICNDRWNADIARIPILDGANYLLIPSFGSRSKSQDLAVLARARENGVPIVEANVGVTLIISKGEIVARSRRETGILHGTIEIPLPPAATNRDKHERQFLKWRRTEMSVRYAETMEKLSK
jgi:predicted amidohydrolase